MSLDRVRAVRAANAATSTPPCRPTPAHGPARASGSCKSRWRCCSSTAASRRCAGTNGGTATRSGWSLSPTNTTMAPFLDLLARQYWLSQCRDLRDDLYRDRLSIPDLAAAHAALFACSGHLPPRQFASSCAWIYFSFVMIMGHMSFLRHEWLDAPRSWWKRRIGDMEMIYDGRCGFCVRSMAWFLAFDGLQADPRSAISAPTLRPSSAMRNSKRRSTWSCRTDGRCRASRRTVMSSPAFRDCGGWSRSSTCRC